MGQGFCHFQVSNKDKTSRVIQLVEKMNKSLNPKIDFKITCKLTLKLEYLFLRQALGNFSLLFKVVENGKGVDVLDSVVVARVHVDARETKPYLVLLKNDIDSNFDRF